MHDRSVKKIDSRCSPRGAMGQQYLVSGRRMAMRLWKGVEPGELARRRRPYETVGYLLEGRAELILDGQRVELEPGDSWVVPRDAPHAYRILAPLTAVEVTSPPARVAGRDEDPGPA